MTIATRRSSRFSTTSRRSLAERADFEAHLLTCARCRADLAALRRRARAAGTLVAARASFGIHELVVHDPERRKPPCAIRSGGARSPRGRRWRRRCCSSASRPASPTSTFATTRTASRSGPAGRPPASATARRARQQPEPLLDRPLDQTNGCAVARGPRCARTAARNRDPRGSRRVSPQAAPTRTAAAPASDAEMSRRVRALVEESEKRQQRELALRLAEVAARCERAAAGRLVKIDHNLGLVQNNVGVEVLKTPAEDEPDVSDAIARHSGSRGDRS